MADVHSKEVRSFNMSKIRSKDTKPEIVVRKFLFAQGFRYRLHAKSLPGKPDMAFPKLKKLIFINGCFWHGHVGCKYFTLPKTRTAWWHNKIGKNRELDNQNINKLIDMNWHVLVVFECELKPANQVITFNSILNFLAVGNPSH